MKRTPAESCAKEEQSVDNKLTSLEKKWVLYDVGNSAFTLLISTIIPIYFNDLAGRAGISEVDYLAYWGYAASLATALVAVVGPVLGTIADTENYKKPIFTACMMLGVLGCVIAVSRVLSGVHYPSDVLAGLAFGAVASRLGFAVFFAIC